MTEIRFEGEVDAYASGGDLKDDWSMSTGVTIGGRDVISEIDAQWPAIDHAKVRVYLGTEPVAKGDLYATHGWTGTDVTPGDPPEIEVGGFSLMHRLYDLDGRTVVLIVEDVDD